MTISNDGSSSSSNHGGALKKVILLGKPLTHPDAASFCQKYQLVEHLSQDRESFLEQCKKGGRYEGAEAVMRNIQPSTFVGLIDEELISALPNLKIFASTGAGYNNADIDAFTARKIYYSNT